MDRLPANSPKPHVIVSDFGELRLGQQVIPYELFEMATHNLGILSNYPLRVGDRLSLDIQGQNVVLVVHQYAGLHDPGHSLRRFRLVSFEKTINFEKFFVEQKNRSLHTRTRMRHSRFPTAQTAPLVFAKTFGTTQVYKLRTVNASRSGMLLEALQGSDAPFVEGTLLELKIQQNHDEAIPCIAKVVRCEGRLSGGGRMYGVALTDISSEHKDSFHSFIETLEQSSTETLKHKLSA